MSTKENVIKNAIDVATANGSTIISNENTIYLMGLSFVIGSLFTIFVLVLLDFMKRDRGIDK